MAKSAASQRQWDEGEYRLDEVAWFFEQQSGKYEIEQTFGKLTSLERLALRHNRLKLATKIRQLANLDKKEGTPGVLPKNARPRPVKERA